MGIKYAVITPVGRDDLKNGGLIVWAKIEDASLSLVERL